MASSRVGVSTSACVALALQIELLQDRQRERGGLAGAGLRLADEIASRQQRGNRARLNRRRRLVAELRERIEERSGKAEGSEGGVRQAWRETLSMIDILEA